MTTQRTFTLMLLMLIATNIYSQTTKMTSKSERVARKIDTVFTVEERANIELWFYDRVNAMKLSDDTREEYDRIVYSYIYDMSRLNDKDKDYSREEIHERFDGLVEKMNNELKQLLTTDQYINHLENFGAVVRNIYNKWGWTD